MSNLSKRQFPWTKRYDEGSGVTWHIHGDSGQRVFNRMTGRLRWQIDGGRHHGELYASLGEAKKVVEEGPYE